MQIVTDELHFPTAGDSDMVDITGRVERILADHSFREGNVLLFAVGSTAALTTIEFEPGLQRDYPAFFESIAPSARRYHHDETWHDGNGHAHIRASLQGPSLQIPFRNGKLLLGTWQQIIFLDFDTRPRSRTVIVQMTGSKD